MYICFELALNAAPLLHEGGELKMTFKLMTKKGNKQQVYSTVRRMFMCVLYCLSNAYTTGFVVISTVSHTMCVLYCLSNAYSGTFICDCS